MVTEWLAILPPRLLSQITSIDIEKLYTARQVGRGAYAMNDERKILRSFFAWAARHRLILSDPTFAWPRLKQVRQRTYHSIGKDLEAQILAALVPPEGSAIIWERVKLEVRVAVAKFLIVAIRMGLRRGIVFAARWEWVSHDWCLTVPAEFMKNREPLRLPMPAKVMEVLGERRGPMDTLIPDLPADPCTINRILKKVALKIGLDPRVLYPHQCRRTMVGRLLEEEVSDTYIQKLGQWYQAEVMRKHYTCGLPDKLARDILEKI